MIMLKKIMGAICTFLTLGLTATLFAKDMSVSVLTLPQEILAIANYTQGQAELKESEDLFAFGLKDSLISYPLVKIRQVIFNFTLPPPNFRSSPDQSMSTPTQTDTPTPPVLASCLLLTGIVVMPDLEKISGGKPSNFSLVVLGHDIETELARAPSAVLSKKNRTRIVIVDYAQLLAAMGYIVLVPDYPGLSEYPGRHREVEPYFLQFIYQTPSPEVAIPAMIDDILNATSPNTVRANWNGKIAFMGYGYGGYTLMSAAASVNNGPQYAILDQGLKAMIGLNGLYSVSGALYDGFVRPALIDGKNGHGINETSWADWNPLPGYLFALWVDASHYYSWDYGIENGIVPANSGWSAQHLVNLLRSGQASLSEIELYVQSHPKYRAEEGFFSITTQDLRASLKGQRKHTLKMANAYFLWFPWSPGESSEDQLGLEPTQEPSELEVHLIYHPLDEIARKENVDSVLSVPIGAKVHPLPSKPCPEGGVSIHNCPSIVNQAYREGINLLRKIL